MAGKHQHHIWQLMQRGFGTRRGSDHQIWVYEKDARPRMTVTRNYGAQNGYLSNADDHSADHLLTDFEQVAQSHVQDARSAPDGHLLDSNVWAEIVTHFEVRSLFLRNEVSRVGEHALSEIDSLLSSPQKLAELMKAYVAANQQEIENFLSAPSANSADRQIVQTMVDIWLPTLLQKGAVETAPLMAAILSQFTKNCAELAKSSHIKSVLKGFSDLERTAGHKNFQYTVERLQEEVLLPDTCIAFFKQKGLSPITQKDDKVHSIVLPISKNVIVHGYKQTPAKLDRKTLLRALASVSYQGFIANDLSQEYCGLTRLIGKNACIISTSEIRKVLSFQSMLEGISEGSS